MREVFFSFSFVLLVTLAFMDMACYAHVNGAGAGMEIQPRDAKWHYYNDSGHDDAWRSRHAWHEDRNDWDR